MLNLIQHLVKPWIKFRMTAMQNVILMKKSPVELMNLTFSAIMVLLTVTGAFVFLFTDLFSDRAFGTKRVVLGVIFLAYALYRSYRMYSAFKTSQDKDA